MLTVRGMVDTLQLANGAGHGGACRGCAKILRDENERKLKASLVERWAASGLEGLEGEASRVYIYSVHACQDKHHTPTHTAALGAL